MAIGKSGRIVIELDPGHKMRIYAALKRRGLTLREWFLKRIERDLLATNAPIRPSSSAVRHSNSRRNGRQGI